jgi:dTDP-4-dehydrorhamnose reductase
MPSAVTTLPGRTLLIGASGQLGRALATSFSDGVLVGGALRHARPGDVHIDLGDASATQAVLRDVRPDLILVAGAMCNVDLCEMEPEACERINTQGPALVAEYAQTNGGRVVFFSTDHVFDGLKADYVEADAVHPLNVYARSKALAEEALRDILPDRHLIVRTGWVYGPDWQRRNFILRLVDNLRAGTPVPVASDQWGSPTFTDDIAEATRELVAAGAVGTFHATGPDWLSRAALAESVCSELGLDRSLLMSRSTTELQQTALRPERVRLDCRKLQTACLARFRGVEEGLQSLIARGEIVPCL